MSPERREGLVPPEVPELVTRVQDLQRTTTVLETDLATADALEDSSARLASTEHQLASVSQALAAPPAPPSEDVTRQLSAQKAMLESQAASLRESVDRYQERVQEATAAPLPAVEDSDAPARVLTLVNQEQDPTPDPVTTEELAAREPESTVVVEEPVDPPADPPTAPEPDDLDLPQTEEVESPAQPEQPASASAGVSVTVPDVDVDLGNGVDVGVGDGSSGSSDGDAVNVNVGGLLSISVSGSSASDGESSGENSSGDVESVDVPTPPLADVAPAEPAPPVVEVAPAESAAPAESDPVVVDPDAVQASAQEVRDRALRCAEDAREAADAAAAGQCAADAASSTEALLADVNEQLAEIDRQLAGQ